MLFLDILADRTRSTKYPAAYTLRYHAILFPLSPSVLRRRSQRSASVRRHSHSRSRSRVRSSSPISPPIGENRIKLLQSSEARAAGRVFILDYASTCTTAPPNCVVMQIAVASDAAGAARSPQRRGHSRRVRGIIFGLHPPTEIARPRGRVRSTFRDRAALRRAEIVNFRLLALFDKSAARAMAAPSQINSKISVRRESGEGDIERDDKSTNEKNGGGIFIG
ncbi:hypothetical protein EVAR_19906_1, partial [Eumeta japonica]